MSIGQFEREIAAGDYVQSLDKGLAVIRSFDSEHRTRSLTEVAEATGLSRPSARRFLLTLQALGYVIQEDGRFRLLPRVLDLGGSYLTSGELPGIVNPYLTELNSRINEACSVGVIDGEDVVYIARASTQRRIMTFNVQVGTRIDPTITALGRVLLAHLPVGDLDTFLDRRDRLGTLPQITDRPRLRSELDEIRERGWTLVDQMVETGVRTIAAPLWNADRRVIAGVNVAAHATRVSREALEEDFLPQLLDTQRRIVDAFAEYGPDLNA